MIVSCVQLLGIISLAISLLAYLVSVGSPYWVVNVPPESGHYGLIAECQKECEWIFANDFAALKETPDWFKAAQGLIGTGLIANVTALAVALAAACCKCYSINPHRVTTVLLLSSFISSLVGIVVFCLKSRENGVELSEGSDGNFGWSLWICVGSIGFAFVTSGIFTCASRNPPEEDLE